MQCKWVRWPELKLHCAFSKSFETPDEAELAVWQEGRTWNNCVRVWSRLSTEAWICCLTPQKAPELTPASWLVLCDRVLSVEQSCLRQSSENRVHGSKQHSPKFWSCLTRVFMSPEEEAVLWWEGQTWASCVRVWSHLSAEVWICCPTPFVFFSLGRGQCLSSRGSSPAQAVFGEAQCPWREQLFLAGAAHLLL